MIPAPPPVKPVKAPRKRRTPFVEMGYDDRA
jgi:hypothetical protein